MLQSGLLFHRLGEATFHVDSTKDDLKGELFRIGGVDLTDVPGISVT
jgi:hypothetical protein